MVLRDYQIRIAAETTDLLKQYNIAYLACEMRTGKTLMALQAATNYGAKVVLFVSKLKALGSIQNDFDALNPDYLIDIINYDQIHNIIRTDYDLVILDEAHTCSMFPTPAQRTKLLKKICMGLPIIFMSGTPSGESFSQLYHQFYISSYSPFKEWSTFYKWAADFVTIEKKYFFNKQINDYSNADKAKIDEYTKHLFISFTRAEAGFTEEVIEEVIRVQMKPTTYSLAEKLRKNRVYIGREGQEILADTEVKLLQKNWQIYSGTVIAEDKTGIVFDNSKASFIKEHFAGKKIAIYYIFKAEYVLLVATFGYDKITPDPEEFNSREDLIFVSQIQAGSMGVNLSTAYAIVMFNIHYSNVQYWQVRSRMADKDRTIPALLCWIFSDNGIEEKILKAVQAKKDYQLSYFLKDFNIKKQLA